MHLPQVKLIIYVGTCNEIKHTSSNRLKRTQFSSIFKEELMLERRKAKSKVTPRKKNNTLISIGQQNSLKVNNKKLTFESPYGA